MDEQWTHATAFHVLTANAHVADVVNEGRTVDGSHFEIRFVGLRTVRGGKHTRIELFPDGAVDAALERLAELEA